MNMQNLVAASHTVCRHDLKILWTLGPSLWDKSRGWLTPQKHATLPRVITPNVVALGQTMLV